MLKKKPYIEDHKSLAKKKLSALKEMLESKGMTDEQIKRDPKIRHHKAVIHKADRRLAGIAERELLIARKAEIKAQKLAAPKTEVSKKKRSAPDPAKGKAKKEKKNGPWIR